MINATWYKFHLSPDGSFYANVNIGQQQDGIWQGFPVVWRSLNFYERVCLNEGLSLKVMGPLRDFGHVSEVVAPDAQQMLRIRQIQ